MRFGHGAGQRAGDESTKVRDERHGGDGSRKRQQLFRQGEPY
jgi:hypothetical protein